MRAQSIPPLALESYQRAARVILSNHLVTQTFPDRIALPLLRRWAAELREDLMELFGYRLEVTETTARLFTVADRLDSEAPARTSTDRTFDRVRYAYLALAVAALGRAGSQITLSELADHVSASAAQIEGIELATDRAADRDAFVDAISWLAVRGAITLADGDSGRWSADPDAGEALYDIDRSVVIALFRPPAALQHLRSVRGLLAETTTEAALIGHAHDIATIARRVRRALLEQPVVYSADLDEDERRQLALPRTTAEVELLTGLVAERRREGVAMIDVSGRLSDIRFPGTGTVAQVALLLAGEMADRILDPDAPESVRSARSEHRSRSLIDQLDRAVPLSGLFENLAAQVPEPQAGSRPSSEDPTLYPLLEDDWIRQMISSLTDRYGKTFAAGWQTDPEGLAQAAVTLLDRLGLVSVIPGGVLVLPALARYRGVVVTIRNRTPEIDLFHLSPTDSKDALA